MNEPNMPKPTSKPVRLVRPDAALAHHPHVDERLGNAQLEAHPDGEDAAAAANRPSIRAEAQPQSLPSLTPISSALSPTASRAAPTQSIFAGLLTGDSGTNRWVATSATAIDDEADPEDPLVGEVVDDQRR